MNDKKLKIRDGFHGEKLISIPACTLQKVLKQFPVHQLYVTHIGYFPNALYHFRNRPKGCEDDILFYCIDGKGYYKIDGNTYEIKANQYVIIPASVLSLSYWADQNDPWTIYWLHFTGKEIEQYNHFLPIKQYPAYIPFNEEGIRIWNKMYDNLSQGFNSENLINCNLCLPHLIATFLYPQNPSSKDYPNSENELVNNTIDYLKKKINDKMTVDEMAEYNHLSTSHFSKLFRRSTGMPPLDYFIHLKMQKACHLLHTGNLRIKEIAATLGYDDTYYFSRVFKKSMNVSPEGYRSFIRNNT